MTLPFFMLPLNHTSSVFYLYSAQNMPTIMTATTNTSSSGSRMPLLKIALAVLLSIVHIQTAHSMSTGSSADAKDSALELIILHNNDMHARFEQTGKYSNTCQMEDAVNDRCYGGFARVASKCVPVHNDPLRCRTFSRHFSCSTFFNTQIKGVSRQGAKWRYTRPLFECRRYVYRHAMVHIV